MTAPRERFLLGSGPIGLAAAAAAARGPHPLRCISTAEDAPWLSNYGLWAEDADRLDLHDALRATFASPEVRLADGRTVGLSASYGFLRNDLLQARLLRESAGCWQRATVASLHATAPSVTVALTDGSLLHTDLLLDARGVAALPGAPSLPAQTAYGIELELPKGHPGLGFRFMDWSFPTPEGEPPSFLYAVPTSAGRIFVEETVLAALPAFPVERLRERLNRRLASMGLEEARPVLGTEERCYIPMGASPPPARGAVIPIGSAAGWVHPASGYLLGHGIGWARTAASAAAAGASADEVWQLVWPGDRRRMWALYNFGLSVLLGMEREAISDFFDAFFALPPDRAQRYLSAAGTAADLADTMWRLFLDAAWPLRRRLSSPAFGKDGLRLLRDLSGY